MQYLDADLKIILKEKPYITDFFSALAVSLPNRRMTLRQFLYAIPETSLQNLSIDRQGLLDQCFEFIERMGELAGGGEDVPVKEIRIKKGCDKNGDPEPCDVILQAGEVTAVVGPTGSGKSRLLADIECIAQGDTPTGRYIMIDGCMPDQRRRFGGDQQLVAQLSQNMNFVMDLSVRDFLTMHARSRMIDDIEERIALVFSAATSLAGEPFSREIPVTALSGGQSRALMIADVAYLSGSPVVLIDEIENAGVDRKRALELLVKKDKIVLIATHDPLLALSADKRLIIRNGGIAAVLTTNETEKSSALSLEIFDKKLSLLREQLRRGERVSFTPAQAAKES